MTYGSRLPYVYELEQVAKRRYPDVAAANRYWADRYAQMASRIIRWERKYGKDTNETLLLINDADRTTRSPGKQQAILDYGKHGTAFFTESKDPEGD